MRFKPLDHASSPKIKRPPPAGGDLSLSPPHVESTATASLAVTLTRGGACGQPEIKNRAKFFESSPPPPTAAGLGENKNAPISQLKELADLAKVNEAFCGISDSPAFAPSWLRQRRVQNKGEDEMRQKAAASRGSFVSSERTKQRMAEE
ncbi:hypothetical protein VIN30_00405 [Adlercreutzia sp. R7]|uniref:Uncharacterized protein n=1 Tax=Adlercreutzia wanghongyangiae TaxID=3111451 RepID=A0ABU6IES2_9ACTN|nr:hypothetical protein [Adlercreutzia sp. R7]